MLTIRRLYLYLMSAIALGAFGVGAWMVTRQLLMSLGVAADPYGGSGAEQLSQGLALMGVGIPVWGVHWWLAERGLRPGSPHASAEHGSIVRAVYLTLVLGALAFIGGWAATEVIRDLVLQVSGGPAFGYADPLPLASPLAAILVGGCGWAYHARIRRRDLRGEPLHGAAAWLPRVYLYGVALVSLTLFVNGTADFGRAIIDAVVGVAPGADAGYQRWVIATSVAGVASWGLLWIGHWWGARRVVAGNGWRGAAERRARLRQAYFLGAIAISAGSALGRASDGLRAVLVQSFGAAEAVGLPLDATSLVREVAVAIVAAATPVAAWWFHQRWLRDEASQRDEPGHSATAERLDRYTVAGVGLAIGASGLALLIGIVADALLGGTRTQFSSGYWKAEAAGFAAMMLAGGAPWLWEWRRTVAVRSTDAESEASSTVRRAYLLLALAGSLVAGIGALSLILYRVFGQLLGAPSSGSIVSELSTPSGVLTVAVMVALYHGIAVRRDQTTVASATPPPAPVDEGETAMASERRALVLSGPPGSDLAAAIDRLRNALPPGHRLEDG